MCGDRAKNLHQRNREFRKLALGCPREIHHDDQKPSRDELPQRTENSPRVGRTNEGLAACLSGISKEARRVEVLRSSRAEILKCYDHNIMLKKSL